MLVQQQQQYLEYHYQKQLKDQLKLMKTYLILLVNVFLIYIVEVLKKKEYLDLVVVVLILKNYVNLLTEVKMLIYLLLEMNMLSLVY